MDIDLVITYVDSSDPDWMKDHEEMCLRNNRIPDANSVRFREWNTLRYIMRGTQMFMPWVRKIHLIVERPSQIPKWVNQDEVNVVFHNNIIPSDYLPTYNSTCIEQFMWKINGLAEHFLYANDDMIPVNPLSPGDFFDRNGNPRIEINNKPFDETKSMYAHHLHNGEALVRRVLNLPPRNDGITRTGHNIAPMLVSTWKMLWDKVSREIRQTLTPFRNGRNINQELAAYWQLLTGNYTLSERTTTYTEFENIDYVCHLITGTVSQLICLNDAKVFNYFTAKERITEAFETKMPKKSKYEL